MKSFFRAIFSGTGIVIIVALVLSLVLWMLGAYIEIADNRIFESVVGRLIGLAVLWIIALIIILVLLLTRQKRDTDLAEDIALSVEPEGVDDEQVKAELDEMRGKLKSAMLRVRKSKLGRRHLSLLPWYIIIGPPGAGKTTAIANSGLNFPLGDDTGKQAIGGVGGTRNCDWWFTENAVLVDTAGRYTTQESDTELDNSAWLGFLGLLRKHRSRQPINGAVVAISLSDLSMQDELTRKGHANAVRRRLHELRDKLGLTFPVYVLFTKADLIAGFSEFFDGLSKDERAQVWGFTLPLRSTKDAAQTALGEFDTEYAVLVEQLNALSVQRMQTETDPQRRSLIAGFPSQVSSVRAVAKTFLDDVFQDTKYEHRQLLRGVYFTSGTQEGTPIDRLMMGMARTFGIGRQALGSGRGTGRSYFLTRLFESVIFPEAGLVSTDDRVERRFRWTRRLAIAASLLIALGVGTVWARSYFGNKDLIAQAETEVSSYRQASAEIPPSPISDTDLPMVVPALNSLRDLAEIRTEDVPSELGFGLYQGRTIGNQAQLSYRAALNQHLLPRLLLRLEEQLQGSINNPELLYETLKVYLTLGLVGPMNAGLIEEWMKADWEATYPGTAREGLRFDLAGHLQALLTQPMQSIDLNQDLVTQVQSVLTELPLAQRVYEGIVNGQAAKALPKWRLTDPEVGGPNIARAFVRSSGTPLNEGVDGLFTYAGFHDVFLSEALGVATRIQEERWILGDADGSEQSQEALIAMSRDILDLYYNDYVARYEKILGDVDVIPLQTLPHAVEVTNILAGPTSPIFRLLNAIAKETRLTASEADEAEPDAGSAIDAVAENPLAKAGSTLTRARLGPQKRILLEAVTGSVGGPNSDASKLPGAYVDARFQWLHQLVDRPDGQPSELDGIIAALGDVYQELSNLNASAGQGQTQGSASAMARFQASTSHLTGPVQRWATQISSGASGIAAGGTRSSIDARWKSDVLEFCTRATTGVYPFNRNAKADISIRDFATLFSPTGLIDTFFNENLAEYVNTRSRPWTWKVPQGTELGISESVLTKFQEAAEIRQAFFAGGPELSVQLQLVMHALDPKAVSITVEIDGQSQKYRHRDRAPRPLAINWPGQVGMANVWFRPSLPRSENTIIMDGPWALFRLLDAAEIRQTNVADRVLVVFYVGGRNAIFQLQFGSILNPFALPALGRFSCPDSF